AGQLPPGTFTLKLVQNASGKQTLGRFRISASTLPPPLLAIPQDLAPILAIETRQRSAAQQREVAKWFRQFAASTLKQQTEIEGLKKELAAIKPVMVPVMQELAPDQQRVTHLL